ncbi:hypothetical protein DS6A_83 [Mycobacterium phage DS6A]|uniref:Uncharacterized protein n=1 Tax=Mycobacterium phage DS6A TaxID=45764 RepID=G8I4J3_9CAUD|nr:hypothetical protein DS6A_83 [Mycobacterium phage DS6A]AER47637.1 hypothetical protein DS6A_83 [Mycobacterium phage DS6A]
MFGPAIDAAMARILTGPITHLYAGLYRAGVLTTDPAPTDKETR